MHLLMDTRRVMSEEHATTDLVERTRLMFEAADRADWDAALRFVAPKAIWEANPLGLPRTSFDGAAAMRIFLEEWTSPYEDWGLDVEEIVDLGDGVTLAVFVQRGHLAGSSGEVRMRLAAVTKWVEHLIEWIRMYPDVDEARAAGERLAEERG
jgi:ketosteroid isomerase-like protein